MESVNSSPSSSSNSAEAEEAIAEKSPEQWFNEQFDNLLPKIQERWLQHQSRKYNWEHFLWNVLMFQSWYKEFHEKG